MKFLQQNGDSVVSLKPILNLRPGPSESIPGTSGERLRSDLDTTKALAEMRDQLRASEAGAGIVAETRTALKDLKPHPTAERQLPESALHKPNQAPAVHSAAPATAIELKTDVAKYLQQTERDAAQLGGMPNFAPNLFA